MINITQFPAYVQAKTDQRSVMLEVVDLFFQKLSNLPEFTVIRLELQTIFTSGFTVKKLSGGRLFILVKVPTDLKVLLLKGEPLRIIEAIHSMLQNTKIKFKLVFIKKWTFKKREGRVVGLFKPIDPFYPLRDGAKQMKTLLIPFKETSSNLGLEEGECLASGLKVIKKTLLILEITRYPLSMEPRTFGMRNDLFKQSTKGNFSRIYNLSLIKHSFSFDVDFPGVPPRLSFLKR